MFDNELAAISAHPPRIGVLPGMRLSAAVPRTTLILLLAFVALFAIFPLSIMSSDPNMKLGFGPSRTVEGRVVSVTDVSGCKASGAHRIVYSFSPQSGNEFRGTTVVCEESPYYSAQLGDRIEIRFLTRDPAVSAVRGSNADNAPPIFVFFMFPLFFLLVLSPLYLPPVREVMRARRLYKTGVLAQGKVVFVKKRSLGNWPGWPGNTTADVFVSYQLPEGGPTETVVWCMNDWLVNQFSPGTNVHILLAPNKAARGVLLEAFIR